MSEAPRSTVQRRTDTMARLSSDVDAWVSTADPGTGTPYLVPLSFLWNGSTVLLATRETSPTGRNLVATGEVRLGFGPTRDVVLVEGTVEALAGVSQDEGDAFAAATGFDPRDLRGYRFFRVTPRRIQAWREVDELAGRDLMLDGAWIE